MNNTQTKGTTIETEHLTQQSVALDTMRRPRERRFEASRERASSSATPSTSGRTCVVQRDSRAEADDAALVRERLASQLQAQQSSGHRSRSRARALG